MSVPFRALVARPGARPLVVVCLLGWFSAIGTGLAVILAVHHATRSFTLAGAVVATQAVAAALPAPARGRLVDRHGGRGLLTLAGGELIGGALLVAACASRDRLALFPAAVLLGGCALPLIAVARGRWPIVAGPELTSAAHALNAALSDCAQLTAPALVAGISVALSPLGALAVFVAGAVLAAGILAAGGLPRHARPPTARRSLAGVLRGNAGLQTIVAGDLAMGAWTAAMELTVVAIAAARGDAALGGLLLAAGALGSIAMSLLAGGGRLGGAPAARYLAGVGASAVGLVGLVFAATPALVAAVLVVVGAGLGLQNVAVFQALDLVAPADRSTEAFTWLTTASAGGGAIGALVAGRLAGRTTLAPRLFMLAVALAAVLVVGARRRTLAAPAVPAGD